MVHPTTSVPNKDLLHKTVMISRLKPRHIELDYALLHKKYVVECLQTGEIAKQTFSSKSRVRDALKANGIPFKKRINTSFNKINTPYGKALLPNGQLEDCPREIKIIALMADMRSQGSTYKAICDELQSRGVKTKMGRDNWSSESVKRAMKRVEDEKRQSH